MSLENSACLYLFGLPTLKDANSEVLSVRGRKSIALLGYLTLTHPQIHSRERLAGLFWPELSDKDARNNLRVSISRISNILGASNTPLLASTRLTVALNKASSISCDVIEYRALLHDVSEHHHVDSVSCDECNARLKRAFTYCTAEFMEGFHLAGCEDFEEWQHDIREQLRASAIATTTALARQAESAGNHAAAEQFSRHRLRLDPYGEEGHRQLMTALACGGDQKAALVHYSLLKDRLQAELGVSPDEATQELVSSIDNGELLTTFKARMTTDHRQTSVSTPHNLPVEKTPYIGNRMALANLIGHLEKQRLVTLTGIGGIGKTRLAVQVGRRLLPSYAGGIWIVRLAALSSRTTMLSNLASVLGVQLLPGDEAISSICNQLSGQKRLLILDNFEHLLAENDVVSSLLEQVHNLTILVTSRQRLQLIEEAVYPVAGLSHSGAITQFNEMIECGDDASELFSDIAKRTRIDFDIGSNKLDIQRIVNLVNGHPLAIVLAASWVDGLSCRQIVGELEKGLGILETESSSVPARQRSVRATFNYSWTLLDGDEQALFCALSIFRGGFDSQAAHEVAGTAFQKLTRLVRKSLLQHDSEHERYEMHELMRQYAEEQLDASGLRNKLTHAHCNYYLNLLNDISSSHFEADAALQQQRFNKEFDNVRTAWHFALDEENHDVLIKAIISLRIMCSLTAHSHDLLELLQPALPLVENPENDRSQRDLTLNILLAMGFAYRYTNGYFARELGDIFARAYALTDTLSTSPELFVVLYGRWSFNFTSGQLSNNTPLLSQWRKRLKKLKAIGPLLPYAKDAEFVLHMLEGPQLQWMGELTKGRKIMQSGLELDDATRHANIMGNYGLNFAVSGRHWLAINQCVAGLMDQSTQTITQAHDIAVRGDNPYLRIFVAFGQLIIAVLRLDTEQIQSHALAVNTLVSEHRIFHAFQHHADIYLAYSHTLKQPGAGIEQLQSLIDSGKGIPIFRLFDVQLFADSLVCSGKPKEAIKYLQTYTDSAERRNIRFSLVESLRIEGDALLAMGDSGQACDCYNRAMSMADSQQAGLYRLRVGRALANYLVSKNQGAEAIAFLSPIIDALPECRHIPDYQKAQTVIASL